MTTRGEDVAADGGAAVEDHLAHGLRGHRGEPQSVAVVAGRRVDVHRSGDRAYARELVAAEPHDSRPAVGDLERLGPRETGVKERLDRALHLVGRLLRIRQLLVDRGAAAPAREDAAVGEL